MEATFNKVKIVITKSDITKENVDCIVNAANSYLKHGGGVALAISKNGGPTIQKESDEYVKKHGPVKTGEVGVTTAGNLPTKYVIHAVGPVWRGGSKDERNLLYNAVMNSLKKAEELKCKIIALPAISSGIFGFPVKECAKIFKKAVIDFSKSEPFNLKEVKICDISNKTINIFKAEFNE
jgi:O-acetyl-ADP-ribose deacetylase (regulator of RNase III)